LGSSDLSRYIKKLIHQKKKSEKTIAQQKIKHIKTRFWGYKRLSDRGKKIVAEMNYQNKKIKSLLKVCIDEYEQKVFK